VRWQRISGFLMAREIGGRFLDDQPVKGVYRKAGSCFRAEHAAVDGLFRVDDDTVDRLSPQTRYCGEEAH
jgi:hypothetical protein